MEARAPSMNPALAPWSDQTFTQPLSPEPVAFLARSQISPTFKSLLFVISTSDVVILP